MTKATPLPVPKTLPVGKRFRIAFLTPEFTTEIQDRGGLGNYLNRVSQALVEQGHVVEVFTWSDRDGILDHDGVRVHRIRRPEGGIPFRFLARAARLIRMPDLKAPAGLVLAARRMAVVFHARDAEEPFDLVQSSDFNAVGLFVRRAAHRRHIVRCSWAADHFMRVDGVYGRRSEQMKAALERASIRRADRAYAPSQFVADYYGRVFGYNVGVVRPPILVEADVAPTAPAGVPSRYLLHFGSLRVRKGTDVLAEALPIAWRDEPGLEVVMAGGGDSEEIAGWRSLWGERKGQVHIIGGLTKPDLYATLHGATATVLPTRADNLPNTVIESLMFGVPVIGSDGASVDELVRDGIDGVLVPLNDPSALAAAMVRAWRGELPEPDVQAHPILATAMSPESAIRELLQIGGLVETYASVSCPQSPLL